MESHGEGARIHLSYRTQALIAGEASLICEPRGKIQVKVNKSTISSEGNLIIFKHGFLSFPCFREKGIWRRSGCLYSYGAQVDFYEAEVYIFPVICMIIKH